jgi:nitroimidazol reductase NimA-like FMN-containing flavoprotein (pyridoxamine 5'-phosphate oxidase superfamily)
MSERRGLTGAEASFVSSARVGHVGTARAGEWPHVVPVCHVLDGDRIVIASALDRKIADLRENASITYCVDVYSEDWDNGLAQVIMSGEAYLVESGPEWGRDRNLMYEKFSEYERVAPIEPGSTVFIEFKIDLVHSSGV